MRALFPMLVLAAGVAALSLAVVANGDSGDTAAPDRPYRAFAVGVGRGHPTPTPTRTPTPAPTATPYDGPVETLYLESAGVTNGPVVEVRHTRLVNGEEYFENPTHPSRIAWYRAFGQPGRAGANSIFAAHVDYHGYGPGPFFRLVSTRVGDTLVVTMANGLQYRYTVQSVDVIPLDLLDMDRVVYPGLPSNRERVTLISCGGTFVPYPGGGGAYNSRVILVAERIYD